jgi:uncharacterized protein (DUF111 family)
MMKVWACLRAPALRTAKSFGFMRIAYLECFSGISGDMFLGALLDAGVPPEVFTRTVEALGVDARLEISRVNRSGISATKLDVIAAGEKELPREEFWEQALSTQQSALSTQPRNSPVNHERKPLKHGGMEAAEELELLI